MKDPSSRTADAAGPAAMTAVPREDQGASATARRRRTSRGSRWCGTRLAELAARVVDSAVNPLLLPEELARSPRVRGRSPRRMRVSE